MVSTASMIAIIITLFITLIAPVIVWIIYGVKKKGKGVWKAFVLGAAGFVLLQMIIRMPILNIVSLIPGFGTFVAEYYVVYCLILAMTAALFEVVARFGVAKILQKKINYEQGVAAGLGHGGIEAILIVGMTYINNLLYAIMINSGTFAQTIEAVAATDTTGMAEAQLLAIQASLVEAPSYLFYLAGYERVLTVIFHTAMSLLVCYLVYKKKAVLGVGIAFVAHFMVDFIAPMINGLATPYLGSVISEGTAYVIIYSFLTVVAIASFIVIVMIGKKWKTGE
ncbi:MAG: YhfC family intramembrane metalloprotease [Lachnospiraceae bacterium]|nr:YhfC family intramembrane metalloprotease [Lachnospiraceae bacterium]